MTNTQETDLFDRLGGKIGRFVRTESFGGILLVVAAMLAMVVKNSPLTELYIAFLNIGGEVRVGALSVEKLNAHVAALEKVPEHANQLMLGMLRKQYPCP